MLFSRAPMSSFSIFFAIALSLLESRCAGKFTEKEILPRLARLEEYSFYECQQHVRNIIADMRANRPMKNVPKRNITDHDVIFHFYTKSTFENPYPVRVDDNSKSLRKSLFDPRKNTFLWMHGYGDPYQEDAKRILPALFAQSGDMNYFFVDYDTFNDYDEYYSFYVTTSLLGDIIAKFTRQLIAYGACPGRMHFGGFSMGGQAIGLAGKQIRPKIARCTSIEPVGPCQNFLPSNERIARTDCEYVEIVHTTRGNHSAPPSLLGDSTFYINGGLVQPLCLDQPNIGDVSVCGHLYALDVFFEALYSPKMYRGVRCDSRKQYSNGKCACTNYATMGYFTPTSGSFLSQPEAREEYEHYQKYTLYWETLTRESTRFYQDFLL